jgi:hypothetical protein
MYVYFSKLHTHTMKFSNITSDSVHCLIYIAIHDVSGVGSLCSSLSVRDQVSHPYKTTGRITVLYILTFIFLDSRRDDKRLWTEW